MGIQLEMRKMAFESLKLGTMYQKQYLNHGPRKREGTNNVPSIKIVNQMPVKESSVHPREMKRV